MCKISAPVNKCCIYYVAGVTGAVERQVYVKYHYGEVALHSFNGKLENLKSQINAKTGIPNNIQKLYYKNCLLNEESITTILNCIVP